MITNPQIIKELDLSTQTDKTIKLIAKAFNVSLITETPNEDDETNPIIEEKSLEIVQNEIACMIECDIKAKIKRVLYKDAKREAMKDLKVPLEFQ